MLRQCESQKVKARAGTIVTADLFYPGLVDGELELYSRAGCVAVEMECSALFVVGSLKKVQTAAIVALDGNPLKWKEGHYAPGSDAMAKAVDRAISVALAAVVS
jgi:uridine phosphorylase